MGMCVVADQPRGPDGRFRSEEGYRSGGSNGAVGVQNRSTGMGVPGRDAALESQFVRTGHEQASLEAAYAEGGIARKICTVLTDDAMARGLEFPNLTPEEEDSLRDRMLELDIETRVRDVAVYSRVYGDAYLFINDSTDPIRPLDENYTANSLRALPVLDGWQVVPDNRAIQNNLRLPDYGDPTMYLMSIGSSPEEIQRIHPSRLVRVTYLRPPPNGWSDDKNNNSHSFPSMVDRSRCGLAVLHSIIPLCLGELEGMGAVRKIMSKADVIDLEVRDLDELLDHDSNTASQLSKIDAAMSVWGIFAHPQGSSLSRSAINFTGFKDVLEHNIDRIAMEIDIPATRFTGIEPRGLNASSMGTAKTYSNKVEEHQRAVLDPILRVVMPMIFADVGLPEDSDWSWPAYMPRSEEDEINTEKVRTETLQIALNANVIDEAEMRRQLDGREIFGDLPEEGLPEPEPEPMMDPRMFGNPEDDE